MSTGGEGTWVTAFEDLQRAPASKLFPLVKVLLQADSLTETGEAATLSALALGKVGISRGLSLDNGSVWGCVGKLVELPCCANRSDGQQF